MFYEEIDGIAMFSSGEIMVSGEVFPYVKAWIRDGFQTASHLFEHVFMIQTEVSPRNLAFAVLVVEVDGQKCDDLSEDGLRKTLARLQDATQKEMTARLDAVKKKNR